MLTERGAAVWDTAVQYHLVHAIALLACGLLRELPGASGRALEVAGWSFVVGVLLFSGSLYLLALGGPTLLGPVTPLGGVAFIIGWLALVVAAISRAEK